MSEYTRERIEAVMRAKGYAFFTEGDYNLNLLAVRSGREATNLFDDTFLAVFKVDGAWETREYACTTDPGTYWLRNGLEKGTAVLAPGQYRGAFALGKHKGEYEALVQAAPVTVYRDGNKDGALGYVAPETGMFGINIHRANRNGVSFYVDKWSAGCVVIAGADAFDDLMGLVHKSLAMGVYGMRFTFTLFEKRDFKI